MSCDYYVSIYVKTELKNHRYKKHKVPDLYRGEEIFDQNGKKIMRTEVVPIFDLYLGDKLLVEAISDEGLQDLRLLDQVSVPNIYLDEYYHYNVISYEAITLERMELIVRHLTEFFKDKFSVDIQRSDIRLGVYASC